MPRSAPCILSTTFPAALLAAGTALAQSTVPHWSTYFGGSARDAISTLRCGPGSLITVVGQTTSIDLPVTPGALQSTLAGSNDVFVARIDPSLSQIVWCTYLGGSGLDIVLDAEVDPLTGITTVVGVSQSTDFPAPSGQQPPTLSGPSDGFVAQIDPTGSLLLSSMFVGGTGDDRVCEVELDAASFEVTVAGVTESFNLPATAGTIGPAHHGGATDAFVARIDPVSRAWRWATYIGGSGTEGIVFASFVFGSNWELNLDRMALALDAAGRPVLATVSVDGAVDAATTATAVQPWHAGAGDVYLVVLDLFGTPPIPSSTAYATFHGGSLDDRPHAIARHPAGGFVVGGYTFSNDYPVTPNCWDPTFDGGGSYGIPVDGFVTWIDPGQWGVAGRRYSTFIGGNVGEDAVMAVGCESSGRITLVGYSSGNLPVTPRCHQDVFGSPQYLGVVARIEPAGAGAADLLYATYVGGLSGNRNMLVSLVLDEVGDALVAGETNAASYPQQNPIPCPPGMREGAITWLPLLPGPVFRDGLSFQNPACSAPIYTGAGGAPVPNETFVITATNAPPNGLGILVLGNAIPPVPLPFPGTLLVNLVVTPLVLADPLGGAAFPIAVPATAPLVPSWNLAAQWFFLTNPTCPGSGLLANSERLNF